MSTSCHSITTWRAISPPFHHLPFPAYLPSQEPAPAARPSTDEECGDWSRESIFAAWPVEVAAELATFVWPICEESELTRLLACVHATPVSVVGGEFTAVCREENSRIWKEVTLSVDRRPSLVPGVHACLDMRLVLHRKRWTRAYIFPPCTHQTLSDTTGRYFKEQDGRMFYGILLVLWCYCTWALCLLMEQPDTRVPDFFIRPTQRLRTSEMGDIDDKTICLYERGRARLTRTHSPGGVSGHGHIRDYASADARDRWRSSWQRFPNLSKAVVAAAHDPLDALDAPSFAEVRESFAVEWHRAGLPVPADYDVRDDGQPAALEDQLYLAVRGKGHGRRVDSVTPRSLRTDAYALATAAFDPSPISHHELNLKHVTSDCIILCIVAMQTVPLIYAYLNGYSLLGAVLQPPAPRCAGLAVATRWAEHAIQATSSTFLVGEYEKGARLFAAPLNYQPPLADVVRTPTQRRHLARSGVACAWCTLGALAGCLAYDAGGRAASACSAMRGPVSALADSVIFGHPRLSTFSVGVFTASPMVDLPDPFGTTLSSVEDALAFDWHAARTLKEHLFELSREDEDLGLWAQKIQPPQLQDMPEGFLNNLPSFDDARLVGLPFEPDYEPPALARLLPKPAQPPLPDGVCARSVFDLMPDHVARKVRRWLWLSLEDLICMRDHGVDCERNPPGSIVVGPSDLHPWASQHVWDFRRSPTECAVALDYSAPLKPTLNADFFRTELADYPNQRILGMVETGVIYQADVEFQSFFAKHLISLPKGYKAVAKELRRLRDKKWYDFTPHVPFWPIYFNGQGSTARKLEPNRDRRTTEGGAPRQDMWDTAGLKVISINEASKTYHMPQHYLTDLRPEFQAWLRSRHLPPTPEDLARLADAHGSKWGLQHMPNLRKLQKNLAVLRAAAQQLGLPLFLFGNDIKDFFNHMENHPSELPLMNLVFLGADGDLTEEELNRAFQKDNEHLVFVSERRMGFGLHPNSNIAQDLSESIDHVFRRRMDAVEDPLNDADPRPAMQTWLAKRRALEARVGGHQRRLYTSVTYCDDNIIGVVGIPTAIRALRIRRDIERESGLIMAIPEKRMLGTWGIWLGILIFSQLGFILIPKSKLLRASQALRLTLTSELPFDEYRSNIGLLEHIRNALCLPRRLMHGLYRPHGPNGEGLLGPCTIVQPDPFMFSQIMHWLEFLSSEAGCYFTSALTRAAFPIAAGIQQFYAASDAATDSTPPGMGGFMHGFFWYLALTPEHIEWLHISVLELLATGFSAIIYTPLLPPRARLTQGADASATVTTFTRETEKSDMLMLTHHAFLNCPQFAQASAKVDLGQLRGDANICSDAVSRSYWDVFYRLCRNLRIRPVEVPVPECCTQILAKVLAAAKARGKRVRPNMYVSAPPGVPNHLLDLVEPAARLTLGEPPAKRARSA